MQITHYIYSVAEVAASTLVKGETQSFRNIPGRDSICLYLKTGALKIIETPADNINTVWSASKELGYRLSNTPGIVRVEAIEDTTLICIAKKDNVDRQVSFDIIGSTHHTIPAGQGFIVVDGVVSFHDADRDIIADYLSYVKPRDYDLLVTGPAEIILIK